MWIKIEIIAVVSQQVDIIVTQMDDASLPTSCIDALLQEIAKCWSLTPVKVELSLINQSTRPGPNGKRGGPLGTPKPQQMEIVKGWLALQGRMNQEVYAQSRGIGVSTLRRWMREFRVEGKL
jgi:hypothetical protein